MKLKSLLLIIFIASIAFIIPYLIYAQQCTTDNDCTQSGAICRNNICIIVPENGSWDPEPPLDPGPIVIQPPPISDPICGNGIVEPPEMCDDGADNTNFPCDPGQSGCTYCDLNCQHHFVGAQIVPDYPPVDPPCTDSYNTPFNQYNPEGFFCPSPGADVVISPTLDPSQPCPYTGAQPVNVFGNNYICRYYACGQDYISDLQARKANGELVSLVTIGNSFYDVNDALAGTIRQVDDSSCYCDSGLKYEINLIGEEACVDIPPDADGDGILDAVDNCPDDPNSDQLDSNNDTVGDACEIDSDGDGVFDYEDNCQNTPNSDQADLDNDTIGDACEGDLDVDGIVDDDNCPNVYNPDQADTYGDERGDACEPITVVANAGPYRTGRNAVVIGGQVFLNGSASSVSDGTIIFIWSAPSDITLDNPNLAYPSFFPTEVGIYTFNLTVYSHLSNLHTATDTVTIVVEDGTPHAVLSVSDVEIGKSTSFSAEDSYDLDGTIDCYEWYFDDHTTEPWGTLELEGAQVICVGYSDSCVLSPTPMNPTNAIVEGEIDLDVLGNPCICKSEGDYIYSDSTANTTLPYAIYKYESATACSVGNGSDTDCEVALKVTDNDGKESITTQTLSLITQQDICEDDGKYWYDDACHDISEEEAECDADGLYWYNDGCNDFPQEVYTQDFIQPIDTGEVAFDEEIEYTPADYASEGGVGGIPKSEVREGKSSSMWLIAAIIMIAIVSVLGFLLYKRMKGEGGSIKEEIEGLFKPKPFDGEKIEKPTEPFMGAQLGRLAERHKISTGAEDSARKYIDSARARNIPDNQIKEALLKKGWREGQIAHFFV